MKKLILSLCLFAVITAFAKSPDPVSEKVKSSFTKEFPGADLIGWTDAGDYYKAVFIYSGFRTEAYFTEDGKLQGSARNILYNQLPLAVTKAVEKRFTNADVLEINEITTEGGTSYLLRLEAGTKGYQVQYDGSGNNIGFERVKK